ncbi:hypothetical protein VNI00_007319 [Paramarasmius palmivorus]|uniref:GST N-terminal domain-containing protein n=1 Tax=Paramarasmius palmivorus TaxID=297713 RepID=A0AAW0D2L4_9AGAR
MYRIWTEYPDIEDTSKSINALPTTIKNGKPLYTLPAIHDPNTGITIADSIQIAEYLDKTYPDPERMVVPPGTGALQRAFLEVFSAKVIPPVLQLLMSPTAGSLNPRSEEYFRRNKPYTEVELIGEKRTEVWSQVEEAYGVLDSWLGKEDRYFMKEKVSFADLQVAGSLVWMREMLGEESDEWKSVTAWHDGRWGRLVKDLEVYERLT